jgi:hypothetical protein
MDIPRQVADLLGKSIAPPAFCSITRAHAQLGVVDVVVAPVNLL